MARFNLDDYIDVAERIEQFYKKYESGRITTTLLNTWVGERQTQFIVKATVWDGDTILATGLAEESFGSGANQTSPLENCETSAIGRAIANLGFQTMRDGTRGRPSRQEMEKVERGPVEPDSRLIELRKILAKSHPDADDRKFFLEAITGRTLKTINELTDDEINSCLTDLKKGKE